MPVPCAVVIRCPESRKLRHGVMFSCCRLQITVFFFLDSQSVAVLLEDACEPAETEIHRMLYKKKKRDRGCCCHANNAVAWPLSCHSISFLFLRRSLCNEIFYLGPKHVFAALALLLHWDIEMHCSSLAQRSVTSLLSAAFPRLLSSKVVVLLQMH